MGHYRGPLTTGITDPMSVVGVADRRTRDRGVLYGRGRDAPLEFIPEDETKPIEPGAVLITSGLGGSVYPKGLIVGSIGERRENQKGVSYGVVTPAENLGALEEVLVIRRASRGSHSFQEGLGDLDVGSPSSLTEPKPPSVPLESLGRASDSDRSSSIL